MIDRKLYQTVGKLIAEAPENLRRLLLRETPSIIAVDGRPAPAWWRICYLIVKNGGLEVRSWGTIVHGDTPFGRGLVEVEAHELIFMSGVLCGWDSARDGEFTKLLIPILAEFKNFYTEAAEGDCGLENPSNEEGG